MFLGKGWNWDRDWDWGEIGDWGWEEIGDCGNGLEEWVRKRRYFEKWNEGGHKGDVKRGKT